MDYNSYKRIWQLAWPLIISGMGQTLINITDTLFLGRVSEVALGASAISGLFYATFAMITFGLGSGTQILIAKYNGASDVDTVLDIFNQSNLLQIVLAILITCILYFIYQPALQFLVHNNNVKEGSIEFLKYRLVGLIPLYLLSSFRSFYAGIGKTKIISYTIVLLALLNFGLNYVLVFGFRDFPALGIKGSAIASSIAEASACTFITLYTFAFNKGNNSTIFNLKIKVRTQIEIISLSYPIILQYLISLISWFLFFIVVERMGATQLAVSNVIRNVYMIIMSPILAFSQVMSTVISHHCGKGDFKTLKILLFKVIKLSLFITLGVVVFCMFFPQFLLGIFTNQVTLIEYGVPTLQLVFVALILFSISIPLLSALSAIGKTKVSFFIEFATMFLYVGLSYLFGIVLGLNLTMVWSVEIIYFIVIGLSSYFYFTKFLNKHLHEVY